MKSNDMKKGTIVRLNNGWYAVIADNMKGDIRMATVYGCETETGSIYVHDIASVFTPITIDDLAGGEDLAVIEHNRGPFKAGAYRIDSVELTDKQKKLRRVVEGGGW